MEQETNTILFISLSCVGDAVMTTPVLESLHLKYPGAVIDIVSDSRSDILYKHCPYRGRIFLKHKKKFLRGSIELLQEVRGMAYDLIVDLRTDGLAYLFRGRKRLTKWQRKSYGDHAVQQLMGVIHSLHGDAVIPSARIWLSGEEHTFAEQVLASLPGKRWLAMAPGNDNANKVWPAQNYAALANRLADLISGVILDGSPREKSATATVARELKLPFVDLAGQTNLLQAAAVLSRASLFVGADSGLGHIAAAMSTPTLTFFSVDRPERVLPWGKKALWAQSPDQHAGNIPLEETVLKTRAFLKNLPL